MKQTEIENAKKLVEDLNPAEKYGVTTCSDKEFLLKQKGKSKC